MTMQTDDATLDGAGPRDDVCCVGACCIRPKGVGRRALHLALAVMKARGDHEERRDFPNWE